MISIEHSSLRCLGALLLAAWVVPGVCEAQSGGIEILAGETLYSKGTRVSLAHLYERRTKLYSGSNEINNPTDLEATKQRVFLGYAYSPTARFDIGALLPFVDPRVDFTSGGTRMRSGESGVGDMSLYGKYRLYTFDALRNSRNLSVIGGVETPTGHTGTELPQPGSGSWDPFAGLAFTESRDRWRFDGQLVYKLNTEGANEIKESDEWSAGVSAAYRYLHRPYPGASNSAKLGLRWENKGKAYRNGTSINNSGSERLMLRPALGFHPHPSIDISLSVELPLYQYYRGEQLGYDFRTFIALGYRF
jgi:hypothetical protein